MDNNTKEVILKRLHKSEGLLAHNANTELPPTLSTDTVLRAINLDECFYSEDKDD